LSERPRDVLLRLAESKNIWSRRIAIISTANFIRRKDFADALAIAEKLLADEHDLIHKAVGWMLREVGKRDEKVLRKFLDKNLKKIPRTTLRYAIERLPESDRKKYLML
jgi:3-methyladenine DNA glycosylase AlkD